MMGILRGSVRVLALAAVVSLNKAENQPSSVSYLELFGRFDLSSQVPRADWPGSGIAIHFDRSQASSFDGEDIEVEYNCRPDYTLQAVQVEADGECTFYVEISGKIESAVQDLDESVQYFSKQIVTSGSDSNSNSVVTFNMADLIHEDTDPESQISPVVYFTKVTEAHNGNAVGIMEIVEVRINGEPISLSQAISRPSIKHTSESQIKLLVFGDSVSAAYGVEGTEPCVFSADTENVRKGYASVVAQRISSSSSLASLLSQKQQSNVASAMLAGAAQEDLTVDTAVMSEQNDESSGIPTMDVSLHIIAWSGKGVVRNYGDSNQVSDKPLPYYYNRTLGTVDVPQRLSMEPSLLESSDNYWNPLYYQPDLVIVMLGSNDYSTEPRPSDEQFTEGMIDFLDRIRTDYPRADVLVLCSASATGPQCKNIEYSARMVGNTAFIHLMRSTSDLSERFDKNAWNMEGGAGKERQQKDGEIFSKSDSKTGVFYVKIDHSCYDAGFGCDYHPNEASQLNIADVVTPAVENILEMRFS